jgi:tRNA(Leu) C34 or U34 (ribose-2'-O)-methylase TrmL
VGPASPLLAPLMPGRCRHLRRLKRAGLDYWDWVCTDVHSGWGDFMQHVRAQPGEQRLVAFTKFGGRHYAEEGLYRCPGATTWLLFGSETFGLPPEVGAWPCPIPALPCGAGPCSSSSSCSRPWCSSAHLAGLLFAGLTARASAGTCPHVGCLSTAAAACLPQAVSDISGSPGGALVKLPMGQAHVRSLNLATCVGVGVFEALRQLDGATLPGASA